METDANDARHGRSKPLPYRWASVHPFFCRIPSVSKIDCKIDSGGSKPPPYRAYPHRREQACCTDGLQSIRFAEGSETDTIKVGACSARSTIQLMPLTCIKSSTSFPTHAFLL